MLLDEIKESLYYIDPVLFGIGQQNPRPHLTILRDWSAPEIPLEELRNLYTNRLKTDDIFIGSVHGHEHHLQGWAPTAGELAHLRERNDPYLIYQAQVAARKLLVLKLGTRDRLNLLQQRPVGNMRQAPRNLFQVLFRDDLRRDRLSSEIFEAFRLYFALDNMDGGVLRATMSIAKPDHEIERSRSEEALDFFRRCIPVEQMSDGVNAYTGVLASVLCADQKVILIDEPEAFLAPTLSRRLGNLLSELASERQGNVIAATHSPDFLIGCVESGRPVNIVRLTYDRATEQSTARLLAAERLKVIMRDPYLRSTGMLAALFHKGAAVGEHDTDRAFYNEINERLLRFSKGGAEDCVFLNGHGWQSLKEIIRPLREMGVPVAAVVDLDVVKKPELADLLEAASVPVALRSSLGAMRGQADGAFKAKNLEPKNGLSQLSADDRACGETLINTLEAYGVFIVPVGNLEKWLSSLSVEASKRNWLPVMFERMGSDSDAPDYVRPGCGDVWDFVRKIGSWIGDPQRKGMPN